MPEHPDPLTKTNPEIRTMLLFCEVSRLARFPSTLIHHPDYHQVYSFVTTANNYFVPYSTSGHTTAYNTDGIFNRFVTVFANRAVT